MLWFVYEHNECFFVCKIDGGVKTYLDHITHTTATRLKVGCN